MEDGYLEDVIVDDLFSYLDYLLDEGKFDECNEFLKAIKVDEESIVYLIAILSYTLSAKDKLDYRRELVNIVEKHFNETVPDRAERLLRGLK